MNLSNTCYVVYTVTDNHNGLISHYALIGLHMQFKQMSVMNKITHLNVRMVEC